MWVGEHSAETSAAPETIWALWADVEGWGGWNPDIEKIELRGPFATGTRLSMVPLGQEAVELRIAEVVENELFVDEAEFGETVIRTIHRLDRLGEGRVNVVYRMEITGPGGDELGPQISADFPETVASLVRTAEG